MGDTTRFLRQQAKYWSPVLTRGVLWVGIAVLLDVRHGVAELSKKLAAGGIITGMDWSDVIVGGGLAGMVAARLFLDQTLSRHVAEKAEEEKPLPQTDHAKTLG